MSCPFPLSHRSKTRKTEDILFNLHLADAFIQSDLQCIQAIQFITMCVPWDLNPQPFALLTQCSTTEPQEHMHFNKHLSTTEAGIYLLTELIITLSVVPQGCGQPRQNSAKRLLNGNGGALNTLFWWRKCCNYGSWEGHSLSSFWIIFGAWWNKYAFNTEKYTRCYSHFPCRPE